MRSLDQLLCNRWKLRCRLCPVDLTERKCGEAEARERGRCFGEIRTALAHTSRAAIMGQLTASIAPEIKQPITARRNARAPLRWLDHDPPDLEEMRRQAREKWLRTREESSEREASSGRGQARDDDLAR